jgi:CheY-like chemotaxis protein
MAISLPGVVSAARGRVTLNSPQTGLRALGHTVDVAEDGAPGLALLASFPFDMAVLDLMMPGTDGATVL